VLVTVSPIAADSDASEDGGGGSGDDRLVALAQQGDQASLELLLRNSYDTIFAVCRKMTGNDPDGADAAQEALIAVARGVERFDRRSKFSTWVYRVAMNKSIDELRRRSRRSTVSLDGLLDTGMTTVRPLVSSRRSSDPESSVDRVDIDAAVRSLPLEFRSAVVLRDLCGLDYAEIAEILDIPSGTVRSRIARGRAALVTRLGGVEEGRT
jgi:RNA polymerase sigma-70 factor (ECF subfamily)